MTDVNILVLAAASRDPLTIQEEYYPPCLIETEGLSLLEKIIKTTSGVRNAHYSYAFLESDIQHFHLDKISELITPGSLSISMAAGVQGSACTALYAACSLNQEAELLILSANELVDINCGEVLSNFRSRSLDAGTVTFSSLHPRYSYVRLENDLVQEAAQRRPISKDATTGLFWFKNCKIFVDAVKRQILKSNSLEGQFYIAPCFNELILNQFKVGVIKIENSSYFPYKKNPKSISE
jgi:hypothetical protein